MTPSLAPSKIKICGICNIEDAQLAVKYEAQYIGLIFVKSSPRYVEPVIAKSIVDSIDDNIQTVGVFQDSPLQEMESIASLVGLDYFQLHGHESPTLCSSLSKPVIKAFQIANEIIADEPCITLPLTNGQANKDIHTCLNILEKYTPYCQHFLFDKPKQDSNSNWLDFAIQKLKLIEKHLQDYFLAGGLNANNIQKVLQELQPSVIDIASGVEKTVRTKNEILIADFCSKVRAPNNKLSISQLGVTNT